MIFAPIVDVLPAFGSARVPFFLLGLQSHVGCTTSSSHAFRAKSRGRDTERRCCFSNSRSDVCFLFDGLFVCLFACLLACFFMVPAQIGLGSRKDSTFLAPYPFDTLERDTLKGKPKGGPSSSRHSRPV